MSSNTTTTTTTTTTPRKRQESAVAKFIISGSVTVGYEACLGHFLEFLKIQKQTQPGSYAAITRTIVQQKGIAGVLDGFVPWGIIQGAAKGAVFGAGHAFAKNKLQGFVENGSISSSTANILAGGIGGGFQGFVLSPTLLLKTRVMTDPVFRNQMSMIETSKLSAKVGMKVIRDEGLAALMKGSIVFSSKRVADWTTRYFFATQAENLIYKRNDANYKLETHEELIASLLGGVVSGFSTVPLDVMVAQIQQASKAGQKVGVVATFVEQYKQGGLKQIGGFATRGFVARVAHVAFTTALMKTAASWVYEKLYS